MLHVGPNLYSTVLHVLYTVKCTFTFLLSLNIYLCKYINMLLNFCICLADSSCIYRPVLCPRPSRSQWVWCQGIYILFTTFVLLWGGVLICEDKNQRHCCSGLSSYIFLNPTVVSSFHGIFRSFRQSTVTHTEDKVHANVI